jgi:hypothetical protein
MNCGTLHVGYKAVLKREGRTHKQKILREGEKNRLEFT